VEGTGEATRVLVGTVAIILMIGGVIIGLLLSLALFISFLFVTQTIVLEGYGPISALGRSFRLVWSSFWRILGIFLLLYIMVTIITLVPTGVLGFVVGLVFDDPIKDFTIRQSLSMLIGYVAQILVLPLLLTGYTLLYYDMRVRKEGYDIVLQVSSQVESADTAPEQS